MSKKLNPINRWLSRSLMVVCGLMLAVPVAMAKNAAPHTPVWQAWQPQAEGFIARRRVPPRLELPVEERRAPEVQARDLERSARKWGKSGKSAAATVAADSSAAQTSAPWLYTDEAGLYALPLSELAASTGLDIRQLRTDAKKGRFGFTNEGVAVAWYFDTSNDRLLFAGEKYETFLTEGNAYQVQQTQQSDLQRMSESGGKKPKSTGEQTAFRDVLHFEEEGDLMIKTWIAPEDPDSRYWFWDGVRASSTWSEIDIPLQVPTPAAQGTAELRAELHGFVNRKSGDDHTVEVMINERLVGTKSWDGMGVAEFVAEFDQAWLNPEGANTFTLKSEAGAQMLAWVEVAYDRAPVADSGQIWLRKVVGGVQAVSGFTSRSITVIESPESNGVVRQDVNVYRSGDGWAVAFAATPGSDYLIVEASSIRGPVVDAREQANLMSAQNQADYLIIAPREFSATAEALAGYRQGNYGAVEIAWLDDIYKSFGFGREDPFAISRFMGHVRAQWASVPSAVLLVGNGSLDRKDVMGYGDNFLPVLMTSNPWALAASDARLLGDEFGTAGQSYGRLSIVKDAEGLAYLDKLIAHEAQFGAPAASTAVVVADNPDEAGQFHDAAEGLALQLEGLGMSPVTRLYYPSVNVGQKLSLTETWETGFVSYSGHGSPQQVGNGRENFLTVDHAAALSNTTNYPVFAALTCAAGSDVMPGTRSLASALVLNPNGGAIASLASSGLSLDSDAHFLGEAFIDGLYRSDNNVGDALADAKLDLGDQISSFMMPIYGIIGEPTVRAR